MSTAEEVECVSGDQKVTGLIPGSSRDVKESLSNNLHDFIMCVNVCECVSSLESTFVKVVAYCQGREALNKCTIYHVLVYAD